MKYKTPSKDALSLSAGRKGRKVLASNKKRNRRKDSIKVLVDRDKLRELFTKR